MSMAVADPEAVANILGTGTVVENTLMRAGGVANRRTTTPSGVKIDNSDNIQMAANTWLGRGAAASRMFFDETDGSIAYSVVGAGAHKFIGASVGIGTETPSAPLDVAQTYTDATGANAEIDLNVSVTASGSYFNRGLYVLASDYGVADGVTNSGYAVGAAVNANIQSEDFAGTLAAQYGLWVKSGISGAAGAGARTVTAAYGVYIEGFESAGTVTTHYGVYQTGASRNYFGGSIQTAGNITMPEDGWIGIGAGAERLIFDGTSGYIQCADSNFFFATNQRILFRDGNTYIASDGANLLDVYVPSRIDFNINGGVPRFQITDTYALMTSTMQLQLRDSAIYLYSQSDSNATWVADGSISLTSPVVNIPTNGAALVIGTGSDADSSATFAGGRGVVGYDVSDAAAYLFGSTGKGVRLKVNNGTDALVALSTGNVGIGTTTVPHGGIGAAKLAIEGANASTAGPHVQFTTDTDDYPLMQQFHWQHDQMGHVWDGYTSNGSTYASSDAGSNFLQLKNGDLMRFFASSGNAQGAAITWAEAFRIESDAEVLFSPSAARALYFRDTNTKIVSDAASRLDIYGTNIDLNGIVQITSTLNNVGIINALGGIHLDDNDKLILGTGDDAEVYYNGTNLVLNPRAVGSGNVLVQGGLLLEDNVSAKFGTGSDALIYYDGANLIINPDSVGSGVVNFSGNTRHPDSTLAIFGTGSDVSFDYDGTDFNLKTDLVAASDFVIDCGTQKTVTLAEPVWEDIQFHMSTGLAIGGSTPTWAPLTTNVYAYKFGVNDGIEAEFQELNHKWKEGGTGHFHLHLAIDVAQSTGSDRFAKFNVYVAFANAGTGVYGETTLTAELTIPTGSAAKQEFYLDMGDIAFTSRTIGTQVGVTVERIAATGGTEYADDVFVTQCGAHIEQIRIGSRTQAAA